MPSKRDRAQIDRSGGDGTQCPHSVPRASPRLEILETRCLMSNLPGLDASSGAAHNSDARSMRLRNAAIEYLPLADRLSGGVPQLASAANGRQGAPFEEARYQSPALGSAGTGLALEDPAHATYVIVHETDAPHSTLASAQDLPNLPYFGVIGTLGSGNSIDFYQMNIGPSTAGIQFELVAQQPAAPTPVQLSLYDASGRVLGTWTSGLKPQPGGSPLTLDLPGQSPGSTLYVGISAPSSSGEGLAGWATMTNYQLWVARVTAPDHPLTTGAADGTATVPNASSNLILAPFQPSAISPPNQQTQAPAPISAAVETGTGLALAAGSLPTRAVGPLGGAMASGDTTQAAVRQLSVAVNLEPSVRSAAGEPRSSSDAGASCRIRPGGQAANAGGDPRPRGVPAPGSSRDRQLAKDAQGSRCGRDRLHGQGSGQRSGRNAVRGSARPGKSRLGSIRPRRLDCWQHRPVAAGEVGRVSGPALLRPEHGNRADLERHLLRSRRRV